MKLLLAFIGTALILRWWVEEDDDDSNGKQN